MAWKFFEAIPDGAYLEIGGVNVWSRAWKQASAEKAEVVDPSYGKRFFFNIWEISGPTGPIRFVAGEFSNCMWGFYIDE